MDNSKSVRVKLIHITIIIVGIVFIFLSTFHANLWFDESYSVALAKHSYIDIWKIGGNDVHPILYYWILHTLNLTFGSNIIIYRLFSGCCVALLGILGFTHIRKDFGEKTGLLFSFFAYFLPVSSLYAGEIRMYSLGLLLGTLMAIYAYRIYQRNVNKSTFALFTLCSLSLAYTHYYGLMFSGIINLLLLINLIKNKKERKKDINKFLICEAIQVVLYIPWLVCFLTQLKNVSSGFWIFLTFPGTFYEILTLHFQGNLSQSAGLLASGIVYAYIGYLLIETKKEERKPATWGLMIYYSIIIFALLISLIMHSVILLYRYLTIVSGLIIFAIAYFMTKDLKNIRIIMICAIVTIFTIISNVSLMKENYNKNNSECISYIKNNIQSGDIILYSNAINGAVITTEISQVNTNISYFYNKDNWKIHEAYKAFAPEMEIYENLSEILDNYQGRIWIIESQNSTELEKEISDKYDISILEKTQWEQAYKKYGYNVELIEKR